MDAMFLWKTDNKFPTREVLGKLLSPKVSHQTAKGKNHLW